VKAYGRIAFFVFSKLLLACSTVSSLYKIPRLTPVTSHTQVAGFHVLNEVWGDITTSPHVVNEIWGLFAGGIDDVVPVGLCLFDTVTLV